MSEEPYSANGVKAPPKGPAPAAAPQAAPAAGGSTLAELVKKIEMIELTDQHDFNDFCEAGRRLCHYLAVQVALASGQIDAGARQMAKQNATMGVMGFDVRRDLRAVSRKMSGAADHLGDAAGDFVAAWHAMEKLLEALQPKTRAKKTAGFSINMS
jgi:hypothetical protein